MKTSTLVPSIGVGRLARLGWAHVAGEIADPLFVRSRGRIDLTKPRRVYGILNERCNLRCQGCHYWRMQEYQPEMSAAEWIAILADLKSFLGAYHVNFSGGEPLLRKDLFEILAYCRDADIHAGITTSGVILRERRARELAEARLFNLNISIDGATAKTHDAQRGVHGSFVKAMRAIELMREHTARVGVHVPIVLKSTVTRLNLGEMPALVQLAESIGCSVLFQPVSDWGTPEISRLWIDDISALRAVVARLIELQAEGCRILNARDQLLDWVRHFERSPKQDGVACSVGLDTLVVGPTGDVHNCERWAPLGNARREPIGLIWRRSWTQRHHALACTKGCTETCAARRPLSQRLRGALQLMRVD